MTESWKFAYTTRRVRHDAVAAVVGGDHVPEPGDLVLAEVLEIGQHERIELVDGRRAIMFPGDKIVVAYGNRYAPDQFEAVVPADLGVCDLVAGGGVAARMTCRHRRMKLPTRIAPLGLLHDRDGRRMNLRDYGLPATSHARPRAVAVVGTSMNSGKTSTVSHLVRGLRAAGLSVGACKVTGTGAGPDMWLMQDAGAELTLDFTDAGHVSTSLLDLPALQGIVDTLLGTMGAAGVDVVVFEVADGLLQPETAALVGSPAFAESIDAILFAAGEAMGAVGGVSWLRDHNLPLVAISGVLTSAPLAIRETAETTGVPVLTYDQLDTGAIAYGLLPERRSLLAA
jgi:hypothetical protein